MGWGHPQMNMGTLLGKIARGIRTRNSRSMHTALARVAACALVALAAQAEPVVSPQSATVSGVDPGLLLLSELNCAACHSISGQTSTRLPSRESPLLGEGGAVITPQYLRQFLTDPSAAKPGTTMPDVLGAVPASDRSKVVEALTHFLVASQGDSGAADASADPHQVQVGKRLFHQVGCVACHAPQEPPVMPGASDTSANLNSEWKKLAEGSVPLPNLAAKTTVASLARFLSDPASVRPSGRMPSMNLSGGEALSLAMYLLQDQAKPENTGATPVRLAGLQYQYFEDDMGGGNPDFDRFSPKSSGVIERLAVRGNQRGSSFGFKYRGQISLKQAGKYRFWVRSDDGSRLWIDGKLIVNNWGDHAPQEVDASVELAAGDHPFQLLYYNNGGGGELAVNWEGPGIPKGPMPPDVFSFVGLPMKPVGTAPFTVDVTKAAEGRRHFETLGCASCHNVRSSNASYAVQRTAPAAKAMDALNAATAGGCVKRTGLSKSPDFKLSDSQRASISAALARVRRGDVLADPGARASQRMASMNCFSCHSRNGSGGPAPGRSDYFAVVGEADLGDEGRIPPHLTKVGNKLRPGWLREVLWNKGAVRPYMATRMPQFGKPHLEPLATELEAADGGSEWPDNPGAPSKEAKWGRKLVGRDGLSCIACHTFGSYKSLGIPAMDLTQMTKRLRKHWFVRYLEDPPSLRPGTRMPSFWPEGKAVNRDILQGETAKQIDAIWSFLLKADKAEVPEGLIQGRQELVVDKEPVIYRNFIEGAGSRAIAVGYPEHAHVAFDANDLRLALIWRGSFIDASRHRTDRGVGFEPPMGDDVIKFPAGAAFAVLEKPDAEWPKASGKAAGYRMLGYRLDTLRRPVFMYSFGQVGVEDQPIPVKGDPDGSLKRTLTLVADTPPSNLYFRAAAGKRIERQNGVYIIDGKLNLKLSADGKQNAVIRAAGDGQELLLPVTWTEGRCRITEEFNW